MLEFLTENMDDIIAHDIKSMRYSTDLNNEINAVINCFDCILEDLGQMIDIADIPPETVRKINRACDSAIKELDKAFNHVIDINTHLDRMEKYYQKIRDLMESEVE